MLSQANPWCGCSYIHESACSSLAAQVRLCAGNVQLQRQKSTFCQQMSCYTGDTAEHRWSWVCSGVWGWKGSWAQKLNKLLDDSGWWSRKHRPFLPTKKKLSPHQYCFYDSFPRSFHTAMDWIPSGSPSIISSICLFGSDMSFLKCKGVTS